jgi:arsenate reductase
MVGKRVLFICTGNSARSQMAEALLRHHFGDRFEAFSGGTEPSEVASAALEALKEKGVDTEGLHSKSLSQFIDERLELVVTLCDRAQGACPYFAGGRKHLHRPFADPQALVERKGMSEEEAFGKIQDEIEAWILEHFGGDGK